MSRPVSHFPDGYHAVTPYLMLADEFPETNARSPHSLGGTPVQILPYVEDVDATVAGAVAAGLTEIRPIKDQFYGDRSGTFQDPFGHIWTIATHKKRGCIVRGNGQARRRRIRGMSGSCQHHGTSLHWHTGDRPSFSAGRAE